MVSAILLPYNVIGLWLIVLIGVVLGVHLLLPRRRSVVLCPESKLPAAVDVDGQLAIEACSRWSCMQDCDLACLPQLWFSAEELEDFLARQEPCKMCGSTLTKDDWYASRLSELIRGNWTEGLIQEETFQVVCWNCFQLPH